MRVVPGGRRTRLGTIGDLDERVGRLERSPGGGGGELEWEDVGVDLLPIRYQYDNEGDWLSVETTTYEASIGAGIVLDAQGPTISQQGIVLNSSGQIKLASNHVILGTDSEIDITTTLITIGSTPALYPRTTRVDLQNTTTNPQGSLFQILDANGDSILEVRDDGSFHILTGAAWAADL